MEVEGSLSWELKTIAWEFGQDRFAVDPGQTSPNQFYAVVSDVWTSGFPGLPVFQDLYSSVYQSLQKPLMPFKSIITGMIKNNLQFFW